VSITFGKALNREKRRGVTQRGEEAVLPREALIIRKIRLQRIPWDRCEPAGTSTIWGRGNVFFSKEKGGGRGGSINQEKLKSTFFGGAREKKSPKGGCFLENGKKTPRVRRGGGYCLGVEGGKPV